MVFIIIAYNLYLNGYCPVKLQHFHIIIYIDY